MNDLIRQCDDVLSELYKFNRDILSLGQPIEDDRVTIFQNKLKFSLPHDLIYFLTKHNGISLAGTEIYGIDPSLRRSSLDWVYYYEHFEAFNPMPLEFLPFSPDGRGNHYCLDLSAIADGITCVVFWQHDFEYDSLEQVEVCNVNLVDWIKEVMIAWTLEDYNYDGSPK